MKTSFLLSTRTQVQPYVGDVLKQVQEILAMTNQQVNTAASFRDQNKFHTKHQNLLFLFYFINGIF